MPVLDTAEEMAGRRSAARSRSCRPCAAAPSSTSSSRTRTRTRISFEAAAKRLSADVINFSAKGSSVSKGECLKDTALTLEAMGADAVVVRHAASGAPHRLATRGWITRRRRQRRRRHPRAPHPGAARRLHHAPPAARRRRRRPDLDGCGSTIVGDVLHSRVARSNVLLLHTLGAEVDAGRPADAAAGRRRAPGRARRRYDLDAAIAAHATDVVMMLRVQRERMNAAFFPSSPRVLAPLRPRRRPAARCCRRHAIVMHPGPMNRGLEISRRGRRLAALAPIVEQVANGVSVRMAVLYLLLVRRADSDARAEDGTMSEHVSCSAGVRPLGGDAARPPAGRRRGSPRSAPGSAAAGATVVDADGLVALPGLVDLHTHLREPGREDAETVEPGTRAAALGGFTAVHAMANTDPVADTAGVVEQVWRLGREAGWVRRPARRRGHRRARRASGSPSSARWPTRARRRPGLLRRRQVRLATPCSCAARWSTSRPSTASSPSTPRSRGSPRARR